MEPPTTPGTYSLHRSMAALRDAGLVAPDWAEALAAVPGLDDQIARLADFLTAEADAGRGFQPDADHVFAAFRRPLAEVRVLIVGQDPYPDPSHPIGLAFAVDRRVRKLPPSLRNIHTEYTSDLGLPPPPHGDLTAWADAGVMLLNRVLTVTPGLRNAHQKRGWEVVTDAAIRVLVARGGPLVAVLWGKPAQQLERLLGGTPTLMDPHPSPLSARTGFFGSRPFSRVNEALVAQGSEPIDWRLD